MTILQQFNITSVAIVELDTSAGPQAYSLPQITPFEQGVLIKDATGNAGTNNVTISHPTLLIDGLATYVFAVNYQSAWFVSDGVRVIAVDGRGISTANLSDTIPPTTWTPTDQSGAALAFTSVSAKYYKLGNIIFVYGTLTYPATASGAAAKISLPVAVPNQNYARSPSAAFGPVAGLTLRALQNQSVAAFEAAAAAVTNATLSGTIINFMLHYPAT